jgi:hypothetical protein
VQLANGKKANLELTLDGSSADAMAVTIYEGMTSNVLSTIAGVHGGETVWWTADLPAGLSRVQVVADGGNSGPLGYTLTVHEKPLVTGGTPAAWAGSSTADGNYSQVQFEVGTAGLYDFTYGATEGRYQFLVSSEPGIQKTVEGDGTVRYYLPAGVHTLTVRQDSQEVQTAWSVAVAVTGQAHDGLPYEKAGGNLGGTGNDFDEEWLPLELAGGMAANFRLALAGDPGDGLKVWLYRGETAVYTTPVVYGGEIFWWTADLAAGVNRIKIKTEGANTGPLQYDLTALPIPTVLFEAPYAWSGVAKGTGGHSKVEVRVPASGTYRVAVDLPKGFANVYIGPAAESLTVRPQQSRYEFDVPLDKGGYLFEVRQSTAYVTTTWTVTVSMPVRLQYYTYMPTVIKNGP